MQYLKKLLNQIPLAFFVTAICCYPPHDAGASSILTVEDFQFLQALTPPKIRQIKKQLIDLPSQVNTLSSQLEEREATICKSQQQNEALQRNIRSLEQQVKDQGDTIEQVTKERNQHQSCNAEFMKARGLAGEENPEVITEAFREAASWARQLFKYVHQQEPEANEILDIEQLLKTVTQMVRAN